MLFLVLFFVTNQGVVTFNWFGGYENLNVDLFYYDKDNTNGVKLNFSDGGNIDTIPFQFNSLTKIITHGITDHENSSSVAYGVKAYLQRPYHVNIIAMSWKNFFPTLFSYTRSKSYRDSKVQQASKMAFEKLNILVVKQKISLNKTHILGHSLGAHLAGLIGLLFDGRISRITGFDPAGFRNDLNRYTSKSEVSEHKSTVLTKKCAQFVEAIHSEVVFTGTMETFAHSNIYISDGVSRQCDQFDLWYGEDLKCKHSVAFMVYYESIKFPFLFPIIKCNSYGEIVHHQCPNMKLIKSYLGDEKINPKINTGLFTVHEVNVMKKYNLSYDSPVF